MPNIQCPKCGQHLPEGSLFCSHCGFKLPQEPAQPQQDAEAVETKIKLIKERRKTFLIFAITLVVIAIIASITYLLLSNKIIRDLPPKQIISPPPEGSPSDIVDFNESDVLPDGRIVFASERTSSDNEEMNVLYDENNQDDIKRLNELMKAAGML
jgi:hypothetical protein